MEKNNHSTTRKKKKELYLILYCCYEADSSLISSYFEARSYLFNFFYFGVACRFLLIFSVHHTYESRAIDTLSLRLE